MQGRQWYTKVLLICVSEALAVVITNLVSKYIIPIHDTTLSYIVSGVVLAFIVVHLYDYFMNRRRKRIQRELQDLTNAALMRYNVNDRDQQH
jgi:positive regulator of sigma E activity